jgi:citrate lyase subunit beta/citryl-CoA lyase
MDQLQSLLFVPADSPRKIASAKTCRPDAFIYDLEDSVPVAKKVAARHLLKSELENVAGRLARVFVRVNCFGSAFLDEDLSVAVHPGVFGVVLPKCNDAAHVAQVHHRILSLENRMGRPEGTTKLVLILESAKGVARAFELAQSNTRVIALFFGGEDFCADMGIIRTKAGDEIAVARSLVALAARAESLDAIDGPFTDFHDAAGLFEETRRIKQMGFTGKALIHPNQVDTAHLAMAPSDEEISLAEEVVRVFEMSGQGVAVVRGKMVDEPVVKQARTVLQQSKRDRKSG